MTRDKAHQMAEQKIKAARRSKAKKLDLSVRLNDRETPQLTELPESLGQLTGLQELDLNVNHMTALPESLAQLHRLWVLCLSDNPMTFQ